MAWQMASDGVVSNYYLAVSRGFSRQGALDSEARPASEELTPHWYHEEFQKNQTPTVRSLTTAQYETGAQVELIGVDSPCSADLLYPVDFIAFYCPWLLANHDNAFLIHSERNRLNPQSDGAKQTLRSPLLLQLNLAAACQPSLSVTEPTCCDLNLGPSQLSGSEPSLSSSLCPTTATSNRCPERTIWVSIPVCKSVCAGSKAKGFLLSCS